MVYAREKTVDKDAIYPINEMSFKFNHFYIDPINFVSILF